MKQDDTGNTNLSTSNGFKLLSGWMFLTAILYLGLMLTVLFLVMPVSRNSPLPDEYFELVAAGRNPGIYRLAIAFDVIVWLSIAGFFVTFVSMFIRRAPIRSTFIAACGVGAIGGFFGACFRFAGTIDLALDYLSAASGRQEIILQSYDVLLRVINILFSAGGLLNGIAFMLVASVLWAMIEFRRVRFAVVMMMLSGIILILKAVLELAVRGDFGELGLLSGMFLIVSNLFIARKFWRYVRA